MPPSSSNGQLHPNNNGHSIHRGLHPPRLHGILAAMLLLIASSAAQNPATSKLRESMQAIWRDEPEIDQAELERLRHEAWEMFDHGYSNFIQHAMPQDNLLPLSCKGQDWQGGLGLTLVDALDSLLLMNRRADMQAAVELLRKHVNFDKDVKVHVFETVIRVLGGLVSGHVLLHRDRSLVPGYDGLLLRLAVDLADRLLPAFNTPSGLPALFVNLRHGAIPDSPATCTACAGTLLLEFGLLSALTGDPVYMDHAHRCAKILYGKRSRLGLVGSSVDVNKGDWVSREATIGPGVDSYYEYLLKAYLMFGDEEYLDMFVELYASTMQYMQLPLSVKGLAFMVDVDIDSGRLARPFVSSLGAFWPGMQAMAGQRRDAVQLHANFTAAWAAWGWMPEVFLFDLSKVHSEDSGYNLRPEHLESTYLLHCLTGDPGYLGVARKVQKTLAKHNRGRCGFASIADVVSGEQQDLQESFFLSETVKYLYLTFSNQSRFVDFYVLSTEGHVVPVLERAPPRSEGECRRGSGEEGGEGGQGQGTGRGDGGRLGSGQRRSSLEAEDGSSGGGEGLQGGGASGGGAADGGGGGEIVQGGGAELGAGGGQAADGGRGEEAAQGSSAEGVAGGEWPADSDGSRAAAERSWDKLVQGPGGDSAGAAAGCGAQGEGSTSYASGDTQVPDDCAEICRQPGPAEQQQQLAGLRASFPLLRFDPGEAELLGRRRCRACMRVTLKMQRLQPGSVQQRIDILKLSADTAQGQAAPAPKILAQVVCVLLILRKGRATCNQLRPVTSHDALHGLPSNAVVLQLSLPPPASEQHPGAVGPQAMMSALLLVSGGLGNAASLRLPATPAGFGGSLSDTTPACLEHLLIDPTSAPDEPAPGTDLVPMSSMDVPRALIPQGMGAGPVQEPLCCSDQVHPCRDLHTSCLVWAQGGECGKNPVYMLPHCPLACRLCDRAATAAAEPAAGVGAVARTEQPGIPARLLSTPATCQIAKLADGYEVRRPGFGSTAAAARACGWVSWNGFCAPGDAGLWAEPQRRVVPRHASGPCRDSAYTWGPLVEAYPESTGCLTPMNADKVRRAVVLVVRGSCSFAQKVMIMQQAGAVGVVVVNNGKDGGGTVIMSGDAAGAAAGQLHGGGASTVPHIPAVMVSHDAGRVLLQALRDNEHSPVRLMAAMVLEPKDEERPEKPAGSVDAAEAQEDSQCSSAAGPGAGAGDGSGQCSAQEEQQQPEQQQQQQQQQQQHVHPQLDLMIPANSQAFLQANVMQKGLHDMNAFFNMLVADGRATAMLMAMAKETMAKLANGTSQADSKP